MSSRPFIAPSRQPPRLSQGRTIIELMVALFIGLIVLSAALLSVSGNGGTNRQQDAVARMNEDAAIATALLGRQLRLAGYSTPQSVIPTAVERNYMGPPLAGCENGIANPAVAGAQNINCQGGAANSAPDGLAILYEADIDSTPANAAGLPTDCLGNGINPATASDIRGNPPYSLADNRFYIAVDPTTGNPALYCSGSGGGAAAAIVDNVEDMQVTYGVADLSNPANRNSRPNFQPSSYVNAAQVSALPLPGGIGADGVRINWNRVVTANVCLLLRTPLNVLDVNTPQFVNCRGQAVSPAGRRAYRVVNFTVSLRNRTSPCANVAVAGLATPTATRCPVVNFPMP